MTASNHAVTGALIAVAINRPAMAIPLAFAIHFAMDVIPHFGLKTEDIFERNNSKRFKKILAADMAISATLLVVLPLLLSQNYNPLFIFTTMFVCMSPDLVWGWRFYHELKNKSEKPKSKFSKFHIWIQWSESPKGALVEVVWFITVLGLIMIVAK